MIIYTDNTAFADTILTNVNGWQKALPEHLSSAVIILAKELFQEKTFYFAEIEAFTGWSHLFIAEHSAFSQFDLIKDLTNKNIRLPDRILCLAGSGQNFKGYRDRAWVSLPGNLHLCVFLQPMQPVKQFHVGFTILAAVSVIQALDKISGLSVKAMIKWVNDILLHQFKVAGVLTHTQTQGNDVTAAILGIGLNVEKTPDLPENPFVRQATCLRAHDKDASTTLFASVFKDITERLKENYLLLLKGNFSSLLDFYRERSIVSGKKIQVFSDPLDGSAEKTAEGVVRSIGENLELYLEHEKQPVVRGKLIF